MGAHPPKLCYWCGEAATSKEHVPPENLFPVGHRDRLVTVPSCKAHNEDLGSLDEKMRIYMQAAQTSELALRSFNDKTLRSIEYNKKYQDELINGFVPLNSAPPEVGGVFKVNSIEVDTYFEKIARGLYFLELGKPTPNSDVKNITMFFQDIGYDYLSFFNMAEQFLQSGMFKKGNHFFQPEVFWYQYAPGANFFSARMLFYEKLEVFAFIRLVDHE